MKIIPFVLLFATACFHEELPTTIRPGGVLSGSVHRVGVACAPTTAEDKACDGPAAGYEVTVVGKDGAHFEAKTTADSAGNYTIALPPGSYTIFTPAGMNGEQHRADVEITPNSTTKLDLTIDTGVR
jgi:carboxypeptidase family protein